MEYREIVAVTGLTGLYQLLTTKSDGAIVRNVADKSTRFISARKHNVTPLESIEVYTTGDNVQLHHVFQKMQQHEATVPMAGVDIANTASIKGYFKSIFPEFDEDRVYVSDMKKMLKWYELLKSNNLLHFPEPAKEEGETHEVPAETAETATEEVKATAAAEMDAPAEEAATAKPKEAKATTEEHTETTAEETEGNGATEA